MIINNKTNNLFTFYFDHSQINKEFLITPHSNKYIFLPLFVKYTFKGKKNFFFNN